MLCESGERAVAYRFCDVHMYKKMRRISCGLGRGGSWMPHGVLSANALISSHILTWRMPSCHIDKFETQHSYGPQPVELRTTYASCTVKEAQFHIIIFDAINNDVEL